MKKLYGAIDLHSNNNYLGIIDENDRGKKGTELFFRNNRGTIESGLHS